MSAPQNPEEGPTQHQFRVLTKEEIAANNVKIQTSQLTESLRVAQGGASNVNVESHKTNAPVLASPSRSTVEVSDLFDPRNGYGEKEELKLGDASMRMSSMVKPDYFTCPICSQKNYWRDTNRKERLKCLYCAVNLEGSENGSIKPSGEAATGQSASVTGNEGRGSDDDSQWADTESDLVDS